MPGRVLALFVAVGMIVGAIVVRARIDDKGDGNNGGGPRTDATRVVCAADFGDDVCTGATTVEAEDATSASLVGAPSRNDVDVRAWLTLGPWPQMVNEARRGAAKPALFAGTRAVASSELVAVVLRKPPQCTAPDVTWKCLGDAAVANVKIAAPATGTGTRLLARAAFASAYLGRSDYASNDITDDPAATDWLAGVDRGIERARGFGAVSLSDFIATRVAADVFITTLAEARATGIPSAQLVTPTPLVRAIATLGVTTGDASKDVGRFGDRLQLLQWRSPPQPPAGLPSPGVLLALQSVGS